MGWEVGPWRAARTWKRRKAPARRVPTSGCMIEPWKSTISPTRTKRRSISISSHQKNAGSYLRIGYSGTADGAKRTR